ncbi:hypothetical protein STENM327S_00271 [Streptomyces tendae]
MDPGRRHRRARVRRRHGTGTGTGTGTDSKRFHHSVVGDLTLSWHGSAVDAEPGLTLLIHTAEPGSPSEEGLRLPASWAASQAADSLDERLSSR